MMSPRPGHFAIWGIEHRNWWQRSSYFSLHIFCAICMLVCFLTMTMYYLYNYFFIRNLDYLIMLTLMGLKSYTVRPLLKHLLSHILGSNVPSCLL